MSKEGLKGGMRDVEGLGSVGTTVKEGIIGSLQGIDEIEEEIVSLVLFKREIARFNSSFMGPSQ
jgi:hypothetical protein